MFAMIPLRDQYYRQNYDAVRYLTELVFGALLVYCFNRTRPAVKYQVVVRASRDAMTETLS